jgi:hypothetical protein
VAEGRGGQGGLSRRGGYLSHLLWDSYNYGNHCNSPRITGKTMKLLLLVMKDRKVLQDGLSAAKPINICNCQPPD